MSALEDFDALPPLTEAELIGDWAGELVPTGHPGEPLLDGMDWKGKRFVTRDEVYDKHPIFDSFRRVDADTVMGAMDRKGEDAPLMFLLRRC